MIIILAQENFDKTGRAQRKYLAGLFSEVASQRIKLLT